MPGPSDHDRDAIDDGNLLPRIHRLPADWTAERAFEHLCSLPGCLWLDSADRERSEQSAGITDSFSSEQPASPQALNRYSFVTADPVAWLTETDPWQTLENWCDRLPAHNADDLPPFQGGIAGLIGYEAGSLLEPTGVSAGDDLSTPPMALGLYDVVIAIDHDTATSVLISQGYGPDGSRCADRARTRAEKFLNHLRDSTSTDASGERPDRPRDKTGGKSPHDLFLGDDSPPPAPSASSAPADPTGISSNFTGREFRKAVDEIVNRIGRGDSFQVNLAQRLSAPATCGASQLYESLRRENPAPFAGFLDAGDFQVLSSSPEGFLQVRNRNVETRPIKGTVPRTGDRELDEAHAARLMGSKKDRAENVMIVDLMRNDLSRVCQDKSVVVKQLCKLECYQYVQHLVSVVAGTLRDECSIVDLLKASFPGGSVTGAPKIEAMRTIACLEPHRRGAYCGSLGYISSQADADFNILIRTITAADGAWYFPVGGGITARSDSRSELEETWTKAEGMLRAIEASKDPKTTFQDPL
ncbi:MAG: anthranilate synthase component I family protein [Planctomycetota bacterium]